MPLLFDPPNIMWLGVEVVNFFIIQLAQISSVTPGRCWDSTTISAQPLRSKSFPVHPIT
jgi:hypothetical protein